MNTMLSRLLAASVLACAALPAAAQQLAYTAKTVHLRAGPARDYPVVAVIAPQVAVNVYGCLSDYSWCDVSVDYHRGWVYAHNLRYPQQNVHVPLPSVAAVVGIGVLAFILDDYWHDHYRDRYFYPRRDQWYRPRPVPPRPAPLPPPPAYNAPPGLSRPVPAPVRPVQPAPIRPAPHVQPPPASQGAPAPRPGTNQQVRPVPRAQQQGPVERP